MCCFSRNVAFVSDTRIFARPLGGGRQAIAYQMSLGAPEDLAMILPLPVAREAADKPLEWEESPRTALHFTRAGLSQGLLDPRLHVHRRRIAGEHKNEDILLPIA